MTSGRLRVAVTGLGAVTALGQGANLTFARLAAGKCGIGAITELDAHTAQLAVAAEVKGFRINDVAPAGLAGIYSRADALALLAATEAIEQARVGTNDLFLTVGTSGGGVREATPWLMDRAQVPLDPALAQKLNAYPLHATAARLASYFGNIRRYATFCSACSSSATAIAQAAMWVSNGQCECAVAGGTESLSLLTLTGFAALGATSQLPCRPFDVARSGMTLGEGAAFLVLESEAHAVQRGAEVLAWLDAWSLGAEAHHITQPEPSGAGAARIIGQALRQAGISAAEIGYYNAHGTGTVPNDSMESNALRAAFGDQIEGVLVSSAKGQLGHTLGAAGAVEAVVTVLALQNQLAPPTAGLVTPASDTQLNHVIGSSRSMDCRHALSGSFGFGGLDAVLLLSHVDTRSVQPAIFKKRLVITAAFDSAASSRESSSAADPGAKVTSDALATDPLTALDPDRSRRFDRLSALTSAGASRALSAANVTPGNGRRPATGWRTGLVVGNALGNTNRLCASLARVNARGPRGMAPAEFPQLVHSSIAGNASIYCALTGPATTLCDDGLCCGVAFEFAGSLIGQGLADVMVAGVVDAMDDGAESIHDPYASQEHQPVLREDLSQWFVLEAEDQARGRNHAALARVVDARIVSEPWYQYLIDHRPLQPISNLGLVLDGVDAAALDRVPAIGDWCRSTRVQLARPAIQPSGNSSAALLKALEMLKNGTSAEVLLVSKWGRRSWLAHLLNAEPARRFGHSGA
jgi:3-oxoacyl-[acyl-carrier-protein] synthase II